MLMNDSQSFYSILLGMIFLHVLQLGVPADREQYIHRLGRTGRKGQEGTGLLMLAPWEDFFLSSVKDLPITKATLPTVDLDMRKKVSTLIIYFLSYLLASYGRIFHRVDILIFNVFFLLHTNQSESNSV